MGTLAKRKGSAGKPPFAITKVVLAKLEKLGESGIVQRWAAMALMMSEDTFIRRKLDNADFAKAWERGRAKFALKISQRAVKIHDGLYKNATHSSEAAPGGIVSAQLGYLDKVIRRPDASEELQGQVNIEELGGASIEQTNGPIEIQEVRVRRIRRVPSGRIEDEE